MQDPNEMRALQPHWTKGSTYMALAKLVYFIGLVLLWPWAAAPAEPKPSPRIVWDSTTMRLVQAGGDYGRMVRLADRSIACAYDHARKMWIRHSLDEATSWRSPILVAEEPDCWLTNAELLVLRDGTLLYLWNERPAAAVEYQAKQAPPGRLTRPFLIRMATSTDHGRTWSKPQTLHTAGNSYADGCWEPAGLELPSGELQVYFANESRFTTTAEQEIALVRSSNGGRTWSVSETVAFRAGHRDGMPAPLLLGQGAWDRCGDRG